MMRLLVEIEHLGSQINGGGIKLIQRMFINFPKISRTLWIESIQCRYLGTDMSDTQCEVNPVIVNDYWITQVYIIISYKIYDITLSMI
jgi:hypothetical protein